MTDSVHAAQTVFFVLLVFVAGFAVVARGLKDLYPTIVLFLVELSTANIGVKTRYGVSMATAR